MSAMSAVDRHSAKLKGIAPGWRHAGHPGKPTAADLSLVGKKEHEMKAIAIDDFGAPPSLHDLPIPEPGEGEVLVRVRASSVNGFDVAVAGGHLKGMIEHHFPVVLGKDFAGTVEAAGSGVRSLRPGDVVFGVVINAALGDGAFGEYVTAPEAYTARVPAGLDLAVAGALGLAGTAALAAVDAVAPLPGETVLISGATGGVGGFAEQLAAARGAYVVATARPGEDDAYLRDLGAHHTVDFTGDVPAAVAALRSGGIHAVVHLAGDGLELADLLVPGGRIASTLGLSGDQLNGRAVQATPVLALPASRTLGRLAADALYGQLTVPVQRTYPLADVPRALADFAAGTRGKLAISAP